MIARVLLMVALMVAARPVAAQTTPPSTRIAFLPRVLFHMDAEHLSGDDDRFIWDANVGAEFDLVDYTFGRLTFVANYQVVLGDQFHAFDPNQGNYILGASASGRGAGSEIALVFHHESRHLSDRSKRAPVDWNMLGVRVRRDLLLGGLRAAARADVRGVIQKSFVDYRWEFDGGLRTDLPVAPAVGVIGMVTLRLLGVDGSVDRGTQTGFRGEGGVRFEGRAGAAELFVAVERRVDPYPLQFSTASWVTAGFRLLSR